MLHNKQYDYDLSVQDFQDQDMVLATNFRNCCNFQVFASYDFPAWPKNCHEF